MSETRDRCLSWLSRPKHQCSRLLDGLLESDVSSGVQGDGLINCVSECSRRPHHLEGCFFFWRSWHRSLCCRWRGPDESSLGRDDPLHRRPVSYSASMSNTLTVVRTFTINFDPQLNVAAGRPDHVSVPVLNSLRGHVDSHGRTERTMANMSGSWVTSDTDFVRFFATWTI